MPVSVEADRDQRGVRSLTGRLHAMNAGAPQRRQLTRVPLALGCGRFAMKSNYITPAGEQHLRDELNQLWKVERPRVTQEVSEAAAMGDRSENAEYIYGKKRLREIDRRIQYLARRLDNLTVVREKPPRSDRV